MTKRFRYNATSQMITDNLTGYTYYGNQKVCDLLNSLNDDADEKIKKLMDIVFDNKKYIFQVKKILKKHEINNLEKLDRILVEQVVW